MGLSDACFDFLIEIKDAKSDGARREAVRNLQGAISFYARPPFRYGEEIDQLRQACSTYLLGPPAIGAVDEPLRRLAFVCEAIQEHLDRHPDVVVHTS